MPGTRKLGRPTAHRKAMLRGMVTLLLAHVAMTLVPEKAMWEHEIFRPANIRFGTLTE